MTKATYKRTYWGLTVSESESMTITGRSKAAGRHGTGAVAESLHVERGKEHWKRHGLLMPQSVPSLPHRPPVGDTP